jgi:hypothetical protein
MTGDGGDESRIAALMEENERMRAALQRILNHGNTHDEPCWAIHNGDCADVFQEIARVTLDA